MRELPAALAAMGAYRQFIIFLAQPSKTRAGKTDKFPCDFRTGRVVSAHDLQCWTDAPTAIAAAASFGGNYGVGFVFTDNDPFWFLDMDGCLQPDNTWTPLAVGLCQALSGAAMEVSGSGNGLHAFGTGRPPAHSCKNEALGLEFYHTGRFVALTGINATGDASVDFSHILPALIAQYFPPDAFQTGEQVWTDGPAPEWRGPSDDAELIRRACASRSTASAFGNKASFADLWTENLQVLSVAYPDDTRPYNASQADAALAQHLAFWTGKDCERITRLMEQSKLARGKWDRKDYLPRTILGAVGRQIEVLTDKAPEPLAGQNVVPFVSAGDSTPRAAIVTGQTFLSVQQQIDLFSGCVYISDSHRVLIPGGAMLKPEQFKVHFGGYTFPMDTANERTSRDAWEAFTQSQAFRCPRVDGTCFKPLLPGGAIMTVGSQTFVNTYWTPDIRRLVGDVKPALEHMQKMIPVERDRLIILSFMAACVQHVGHKFQWAPLIQGVEGNGKTMLSRYVAEAVGRRYTHWPKASKLAKEFNAWMVGKVFYAVEDIYTPNAKQEVIEELKPMITGGDGLEIEAKGVDQTSADICGNFIFNSNHKDAIRKTQNDRRFAPIFTAQQQASDLKRDGMTGDYFPKLYDWARDVGYAYMTDFLMTFPIPPEFNPALGAGGLANVAPVTSSTLAAIEATQGSVEQEILEAIGQGTPGFCGGWISSIQLDRLLEKMGIGRRLPHSKRKELLHDMGYEYHPAFTEGRVNNVVLPDGGKPRLFVKTGSPALGFATAAEAAKGYEQANNHNRVPFPLHNV
jgi:hypothetical protein